MESFKILIVDILPPVEREIWGLWRGLDNRDFSFFLLTASFDYLAARDCSARSFNIFGIFWALAKPRLQRISNQGNFEKFINLILNKNFSKF